MYRKLLFLPSISLLLGALFFGVKVIKATCVSNGTWGGWVDSSACVASTCGTSAGTKTQSRTCAFNSGSNDCNLGSRVCDKECPTVSFSASHQVVDAPGHYGDCPAGYTVSPHDAGKCKKYIDPVYDWRYADKYWDWGAWNWVCPTSDSSYNSTNSSKACKKWVKVGGDYTDYKNRPWIPDTYTTKTFGPISVKYVKSSDPNHCHRPTGESLAVPSWAMSEFNHLPEWKNSENVNCRYEGAQTQIQVVACTDAPVIACPTESPFPSASPSESPTESPTAVASATPTENPTEEPTATPAPTTPSCSEDEHLDLSGTKCLKWELGGPPASSGVGGANVSTGQVLGASTMATTGTFEETLFNLIFVLGSLSTAFGLRKFASLKVK